MAVILRPKQILIYMFSLNDKMRYYLCPQPISMRKGINALCGVVHEQMSRELRNSDVYVFVNKSLNLMKLLHTEDGGPVPYVKRLEAGRFHLPDCAESASYYLMDWHELFLIVEGVIEDPRSRIRRLRAERKEYHA